MLFELMTPQMNHVITKQIENLINNYEPRCRLVQVHTQPMFERNAYAVSDIVLCAKLSRPCSSRILFREIEITYGN